MDQRTAATPDQRRATTAPVPTDGPALPLLHLHRQTTAHQCIPHPPEPRLPPTAPRWFPLLPEPLRRSTSADGPPQRQSYLILATDQRCRCCASTAGPPRTTASPFRRSGATHGTTLDNAAVVPPTAGAAAALDQRRRTSAPTDHCSAKPPPRSHVPLIPISGVFVFASPCPGSLRGGGGVAVPDRILPMRPWLSRSKSMRALAACRPALRLAGRDRLREMEDAVGAEAARVKCCKCFIRPRLSAGLLAVFAPVLSTADGTRELQQAVAGVLQSGIAKHSKHLTN
uniref:Uncharacterized protein n=1 Tax=Oryza glumipatula TaxID=40148 RepID=A0A0D9ZIF4_9ORYZ